MKYRVFSLMLAASALSINLYAYSPDDQQGTLYKGLQNLNKLADTMGLDRKQSLGTVGINNLISSFLSPWNEVRINYLIKRTGNIKQVAKDVISGAFANPLFDLSGFAVQKEDFLDLVERSSFLQTYDPKARGVTISDADALFVPTDTPLTKDLAKTANTATDQKSSSTRIPANTPVFIFGQLFDLPAKISPDEDSWFLVWREEFGLKFVRSRHIGRLSQSDIEEFERLVTSKPEIVRTGRVEREFHEDNFKMLMPGTMPLHKNDGTYQLAKRKGQDGEIVQFNNSTWTVYRAKLTPAELYAKDKVKPLDYHIKQAPMNPTIQNYLQELHNRIFRYPNYAGSERNYHWSFAWGEGEAGIDEQHGQDISNFVYKLMLGFGHRLPRYSGHQITEGLSINTITVDYSKDKESHYRTLVEDCTLGRMASFARSAHMVCIGSVSMAQLRLLDSDAATDALNNGMKEEDLVPLVATSPVGFRDVETGNWTIVPKAAIFPIFKTGPYSSWISRKEDFKVFSFFTNSPRLTTKTEL
ncbi:hypothetical protein NX722_24675 [Endozoicomonas gorgoniicola]|uniref:Uncharacterized protein n=1 Tax=Endozoicomonas gorgoniicola TaxID=1234144 RepID=A0ABT3N2A7_9GAMM|nr:hypothetical protein [Endozoicomonas gorgoniicola]MCW7555765.1 hypothetical protein [Endozoicomonas gorgoniicola]